MRSGFRRRLTAALLGVTALTAALGVRDAANAAGIRPTVTGVVATFGPSAGGEHVTVHGTAFTGTPVVLFGTSRAPAVRRLSSSSLVVTAPRHAAGWVDVRVTTPAGTSIRTTRDRFTFVDTPQIASLSPTSGPTRGGNRVLITGQHLVHVSAVRFGGASARSWTAISSTQLSVLVPASAVAGVVYVRVSAAGGLSSLSYRDRYEFVAPPAITAVDPASGRAAGGDRVTITGRNFRGITAVRFGGVNGSSLHVVSTTSVQATSPAHALGRVDIQVVGKYGTSAAVAADHFSYVAPPTATVTSAVAPGPDGYHVIIRDTGCDATTCYAVGYYSTQYAEYPVIETLADSTWTLSYAPLPSDAITPHAAELYSLSCLDDGCVAVGAYVTNTQSQYTRALVLTLSGGAWTTSSAAPPSGLAESYLSDVVCSSTAACVASGDSPAGWIVASWNGYSWTSQLAGLPAGAVSGGISISDIACGSPTHCVMVGSYSTGGTDDRAYAETFDGTGWSSRMLPDPESGTSYSLPEAVSCPSSTQCVVVGQYGTGSSTATQAFVAVGTGKTWTTSRAPMPADAVAADSTINGLDDVSCRAGRCMAAGEYNTAAGNEGFTVRFANGVWTASPQTTPTGVSRDVDGVGCVTDGLCVVARIDTPTTGPATGSVLALGPGGATEAAVPVPATVADSNLSLARLHCTTAGMCTALGWVDTSPQQSLLVTISV